MDENESKSVGPIDGIFLFLAEKTDGKKTISGALLLIGGILTLIFTPNHSEAGMSAITSGILALIVGLTHKAIKKNQ